MDYRIGEAGELGVAPDEITRFIHQHWGHAVCIQQPFFYRWQFLDSPHHGGHDPCLLVLGEDGRIYGFMGVNRRPFRVAARTVDGAELTTWILSPEVRGLGLGKRIVARLQERYEALLGLGVTDEAQRIYIPAGIRYCRHVPRYVRVLDPEALGPAAELSPLGQRMVEQRLGVSVGAVKGVEIEAGEVARIAAEVGEGRNAFDRSVEYLSWRYAGHPVYKYGMWRVETSAGAAAVVLRLDGTERFRFVHVIEVLGDDGVIPDVLAFLETHCRETGAAAADFYCTDGRLARHFWHGGWFSAVDDEAHLRVANHLHPVEIKRPPTKSMILWSRHDLRELLDVSRLYFTKGDCDFDRPTTAYLVSQGLVTGRG